MGLTLVKCHWPYLLDPAQEQQFTVEEEIQTAKFILSPMLRLYNSSGANVQLTINHILDLGFGSDPLRTGTYTYELVNEEVPTGSIRDFEFAPQLDLDTVTTTRHVVKIENLDLVTERLVRFILFGYTDIKVQLPASQEIIRARTT